MTDGPAPAHSGIRRAALAPAIGLVVALAFGAPDSPGAGARAAADAVRPGAAHAWLADFQSRFPHRSPGNDAYAAAPDHIAASFRDAGALDVRFEEVPPPYPSRPPLRNVLARVPGVDGAHAVVLAAHHDTVPGAPGAIDDGGAVAVLVETARVLAAGPPPGCDVVFAVFDGEESGLLGSKAHVAALGDAGRARIRAAVAVELVGWKADRLVVHTLPHGFAWDAAGIAPSWLVDHALAAGDAAGAPLHHGDPLLAPWYPGVVRLLKLGTGSDAGAYLEQGVPACMIAGSSLTNFYDAYHRRGDDMTEVSPARLDDATRVVAALAAGLAGDAGADSDRELGTVYLFLLGRKVPHLALIAVALLTLLPAWRGARALRAVGAPEAAFLLWNTAVVTLIGALAGSVAGVVIGVPAVVGAALATTLRPTWRLVAILPGLLPGLVQGAVGLAALGIVLGWRGGIFASVVLVAIAVGAIGCAVTVRIAPAAARVPHRIRGETGPRED